MAALYALGILISQGNCGGPRSEDSRPPIQPLVWNLTATLAPEQLATNTQIYQALPFDECDAENSSDNVARPLAEHPTAENLQALHELAHSGSRTSQAAVGRAYVHIALGALARGDYDMAARFSINTYLSGTPHRVRLEVLRVYCRSGDPTKTAKTIRLIESGAQDPYFQPVLTELRSARIARLNEM
jgi:hypothetical protein